VAADEGTLFDPHRRHASPGSVLLGAVVGRDVRDGTALGDLSATTFHLGYFGSGLLFAAVIAIPAAGYWRLGWNAIFSFWFAYVATRPLGASFADWMGKPKSVGGLGWGDGRVLSRLPVPFSVWSPTSQSPAEISSAAIDHLPLGDGRHKLAGRRSAA